MENFIQNFHHTLWEHLSISEIGISDQIPKEKIAPSSENPLEQSYYKQIKTSFLDFGEHKLKYVWGDKISSLWEDNLQRTCYFPWDKRSFVWNSAKLEHPTPIHKIVFTSSANQKRNLGVKIQVSTNHIEWNTLYEINKLDIKKLLHSPLEIFFYDNTKYLYIRIAKDNTADGYDIESIKVYAYNDQHNFSTAQSSLFYVLKGSVTINGLRYRAPFGFVKTPLTSFTVTTNHSEKNEIFWISFKGDKAIKLLEESSFQLKSPIFTIHSQTYIQYLNELIDDHKKVSHEENQFELIAQFMKLLAIHSAQNELHSDTENQQNKYVVKALQFIETNRYEEISLSDIAGECHISEKYLIKIFKERLGIPPKQYQNRLKIQKAKKMLRTTNDSISQISETLNFSSPEYFCRLFKKEENCSPTQYRKCHPNENG